MVISELLAKVGVSVDHHGFEQFQEHIEGIHRGIELIGAIELGRALFEIAEKFANLGESIETSAIQTGLGIEKFQALSFAASQSAIGTGEITAALGRLNRQLYGAQHGSEQAKKAFKLLGIPQETINGLHDSREAFLAVADGVNRLGTQQEKQFAVQQLFGRGGAKYLKFLKEGSAGIKELEKRGISIGAVLGEDQVENLAKFEDAMSGLLQVFRTFGAFVGGTFAPVIQMIVEKFEDFWAVNQKLIKTSVEDWAVTAAYAFAYIAGFIKGATEDLADFIVKHKALVVTVGKVAIGFIAFTAAIELAISAIGVFLGPFRLIFNIAKTFQALGGLAGIMGTGLLVLQLGAAAVAIATIYATLRSVWELFHGKSWEETSFARWSVGLNNLTGGLATRLGDAVVGADSPQGMPAGGAAAFSMLQGLGQAGSSGAQTLADLSVPVSTGTSVLKQEAGQGPISNDAFTQNNTFTINITGGDPKSIAEQIHRIVGERDQQMRDVAKRHLASATAP